MNGIAHSDAATMPMIIYYPSSSRSFFVVMKNERSRTQRTRDGWQGRGSNHSVLLLVASS